MKFQIFHAIKLSLVLLMITQSSCDKAEPEEIQTYLSETNDPNMYLINDPKAVNFDTYKGDVMHSLGVGYEIICLKSSGELLKIFYINDIKVENGDYCEKSGGAVALMEIDEKKRDYIRSLYKKLSKEKSPAAIRKIDFF